MPPGRKGTRKEAPAGGIDIRSILPCAGLIRARGYARVSSLAQVNAFDPLEQDAKEISLPQQIEAIRSFCVRRGYEYTGCHWDVKSAVSSDRRGLYELCIAARNNELDVILIWRTNRLFRGTAGGALVYRAWEDAGRRFKVESITDDCDLERFGLLAWATRVAMEDLRTHSIESRLARARRGEAVSGILPYWLVRDRRTRRPVLVHPNVDAVLHAITMYLSCKSKRTIAEWMRTNAPPHPSRTTAWNPMSIHNLLRHSALYGDLWYSRARPTLIPVAAIVHKNEFERSKCNDVGCVACTVDFTYEDIEGQRRRQTKLQRGQPRLFEFPLRNLVFCGVCNTAMVQSTQRFVYHRLKDGTYKKYPLKHPISLLRCQSQQVTNTSGKRCRDTGYLRLDWVLDGLKRAIRTIANDQVATQAVAPPVALSIEPGDFNGAASSRRLTEALEYKTRQLAQLWRDRQSGSLDPDVFRLLNFTLREEKTQIERHLEQLLIQQRRKTGADRVSEDAVTLLRHLSQSPAELDSLDDEGWSQLIRTLLKRVDVMQNRSLRCQWQVPGVPITEVAAVEQRHNARTAPTTPPAASGVEPYG